MKFKSSALKRFEVIFGIFQSITKEQQNIQEKLKKGSLKFFVDTYYIKSINTKYFISKNLYKILCVFLSSL